VSAPDDIHASALLRYPGTISNLAEKQAVAQRIAGQAQDGQVIGIGSGSNAYLTLWAVGRRAAEENLRIRVTTASLETEAAAVTLGLPLIPLGAVDPDWGVDGADEVDPDNRLLKGRGGALFKEKILWRTARQMYLAVDSSKYVQRLGQGFPVPIEVFPAAARLVGRELAKLGSRAFEVRLAAGKDGPIITEAGNLIIDAWFDEIAAGLHGELKSLPGVIETGLFEGYAFEVL
jgi:ribose 5-phosphate isomerase A